PWTPGRPAHDRRSPGHAGHRGSPRRRAAPSRARAVVFPGPGVAASGFLGRRAADESAGGDRGGADRVSRADGDGDLPRAHRTRGRGEPPARRAADRGGAGPRDRRSRQGGALPPAGPRETARALAAGQGLVAETVRLLGSGTQSLLAVSFVVLVVALEPFRVAVPLERQHVGGNPVEEPAIVADDDGATREGEEGVLEGTEGVHVEVVGGLVQEEQVAAGLEQLGHVQPIPLAAREVAYFLLLIAAL